MKNLGDIAREALPPEQRGETPDMLRRDDRCSCEKSEGVYGRGGWHLRRNPTYPHQPAADLVVARCPEASRIRSELTEWRRTERQFEQELHELFGRDDLSISQKEDQQRDLLAQLGEAQDQIRDLARRLRVINGTEEEQS